MWFSIARTPVARTTSASSQEDPGSWRGCRRRNLAPTFSKEGCREVKVGARAGARTRSRGTTRTTTQGGRGPIGTASPVTIASIGAAVSQTSSDTAPRTTQDRSAAKGSSPRGRGQGSDESVGPRSSSRNQVTKLLEGSGRFVDLTEVIFIVILIAIDDLIGENEELSTPIEGTVWGNSGHPQDGRHGLGNRAVLGVLAGHVLELVLGADDRLAGLGFDPAVGAVGLKLASLEVVGEDDGQNAVDDPARSGGSSIGNISSTRRRKLRGIQSADERKTSGWPSLRK